ncbi:MAG: beta-lactamase family protein [Acidobacteria bacterium]|nr:beta-lactamase family protein [Acidobacteriota bacterium]
MRALCILLLLPFAATAAPGFDDVFSPLASTNTPGLAVLIRQDGRTVYRRGFGARDLRTLAPIDAVTNFRLASFTKQFTAASIMLLVHDGKLRYDTALTEFFLDFPAWGRAITIRHLLTHTSGLPDYEDLMGGGPWTAGRQIQDGEALALIERQPHGKFAPGTSWAYSNSAYVVLGLAVAKVSGKPFPEFLHDRIFAPLGMTGTLAFIKGKSTLPNRAYGHSRRDGRFVETDQSSTSATLGDGGIYSNLTDLAKWDDALARHTLLSEAEMRPALTPATLAGGGATRWPLEPDGDNLAPGKPVAYGYGWFLDPFQGRACMWHTGTTTGFRTFIARLPKEKITVVILANRADLDPRDLGTRAIERLLNPAR